MPSPLRAVLSAVFLPLLFVFLLGLNLTQMLSLLVRPFSGSLFRLINRTAAMLFFSAFALLITRILRVRIVQTGDLLPARENAFVVANHQSMADIPALV